MARRGVEPIVGAPVFEQAQRIIESRHPHLSNEALLDRLKELLQLRDRLSGLLIDETEDMPSSSCYTTRFGSLTRAYTLVGWTPDLDFSYVEVNRILRRRHAALVSSILDELLPLGATVSVDSQTDLLKINSEYSASLIRREHVVLSAQDSEAIPARCRETPAGNSSSPDMELNALRT
ncbi:MAG: hypothetical protein ABI197_03375 [Granulicella sp.]